MTREEIFLEAFAKFGFTVDRCDQRQIIGHADGRDVGVYLTIDESTFSIDLVFHFMKQTIFYWQYYDCYADIEYLIIKNHILSEQLCEIHGLAIHT